MVKFFCLDFAKRRKSQILSIFAYYLLIIKKPEIPLQKYGKE
jgi:hypothetical protein